MEPLPLPPAATSVATTAWRLATWLETAGGRGRPPAGGQGLQEIVVIAIASDLGQGAGIGTAVTEVIVEEGGTGVEAGNAESDAAEAAVEIGTVEETAEGVEAGTTGEIAGGVVVGIGGEVVAETGAGRGTAAVGLAVGTEAETKVKAEKKVERRARVVTKAEKRARAEKKVERKARAEIEVERRVKVGTEAEKGV